MYVIRYICIHNSLYMNCCDRLLVIFIVFSFFQYQLRWSRDEIKANLPWSVVLNGSTVRVPVRSSAKSRWKKVSSIGMVRANITSTSIVLDHHQGAFIDVVIHLVAPPLSYHTILVGDRNVSMVASPTGSSFASVLYALSPLTRQVDCVHRFDGMGDGMGDATAGVELTARIFHT